MEKRLLFTRKHYQFIAEVLGRVFTLYVWDEGMIDIWCSALRDENPKFSREKFISAIKKAMTSSS